jgi:hypothetical protein
MTQVRFDDLTLDDDLVVGGDATIAGALGVTGAVTLASASAAISATAAGTAQKYIRFASTGANAYFGIQDSLASFFSGAPAYDTTIYSPANPVTIIADGQVSLRLKAGSCILGSAALATNATDGFLYLVACAGQPTGVPTAFSGRNALIYDSTNKKINVYDGGWIKTAALT